MPLAYQVLTIRIFHFYSDCKDTKNKITTKLLDFFLYNLRISAQFLITMLLSDKELWEKQGHLQKRVDSIAQ